MLIRDLKTWLVVCLGVFYIACIQARNMIWSVHRQKLAAGSGWSWIIFLIVRTNCNRNLKRGACKLSSLTPDPYPVQESECTFLQCDGKTDWQHWQWRLPKLATLKPVISSDPQFRLQPTAGCQAGQSFDRDLPHPSPPSTMEEPGQLVNEKPGFHLKTRETPKWVGKTVWKENKETDILCPPRYRGAGLPALLALHLATFG